MPRSLAAVAAFLFTSGLCALVYQVAWLRELRLVFGATTAASAATVAIFMAGLGIGNALLGKWADRRPNPLLLYACLELGITLAAVASPFLIDVVRSAYVSLGGQSTLGPFGATLARLALTCLVLGIPTILMGGTLPAAVAAVTTARDENRRRAALLYGLNTLGAVVGAYLSTFVLLQHLGTRATLSLACGLNFLVVVGAWLVSRTAPAGEIRSPGEASGEKRRSAKAAAGAQGAQGTQGAQQTVETPAAAIYVAAAVLGLAFMLMELVWYRMLAPLLGGTTFTFGLILAVALLGIGIGGAIYPVLFARRRPTVGHLALTCALEALFVAIPFAAGDNLAVWVASLYREAGNAGFYGLVGQWSKVALVVVFPPALVSGVQFPLLIALLGRAKLDVGRQIGLTYAANTSGSIVGSLAGGFGLMPLLSATGCWQAVTLLLAGTSLSLAALNAGASTLRARWLGPAGLSAAALALLFFPGPTAAWRHSGIGAGRNEAVVLVTANERQNWLNRERETVVWQRDGIEAGIAISVSDSFAFFVNGKCDGSSIGDAGTQIMLGLLGALLHPEPKHSLVVGMGTGETAGWLAEVQTLKRVDVVEIEPALDEMALRCAAVNHNALEHPRVNVVYNDAREVLLTTPTSYDLILSEPSNPYRAGIASLFTHEFYQAVEQRLEPGGLFVQWLQGYEIDEQTVAAVLATLKATFPRIEVWRSKPTDLLLVCSREPLTEAHKRLPRRMQEEPFRSALVAGWRADQLPGVLARYVAGNATVERLAEQHQGALNNDDLNQIEYGFARTVGRQTGFSVDSLAEHARQLGDHRLDLGDQAVDWNLVEQERFANLAILHREVSSAFAKEGTAQNRAYSQFVARFMLADFPGALKAWQAVGREPHSLTEAGMLAWCYAALGNEIECEKLLARHGPVLPAETHLIRGLLLKTLERPAEAAAQWRDGFVKLRTEPWALNEYAVLTVLEATKLQNDHPKLASVVLEGLSEPFASGFLDRQRRLAACVVAATLSPAEAVPYFESFEPHVPWDASFLSERAKIYSAAGHALARQAERDLRRFQSQE